jgi:hypothetical protein
MALAAPIIVFYLIRERPRKRLLSTLLFWDQRHPKIYETPLWRRLRRWVSLLLQILFLALLVFALAKPIADWEAGAGRSRVFVLDASAAMAATDIDPSRFEKAKRDVREAILRMRFFDDAALVLASDPPRILSGWTRSRRRLLSAIDGTRPEPVGVDVRPALRVAQNLAGTRENALIELASGGVWTHPPGEELLAGAEGEWVKGEARNAGITVFAVRRSLVAPGEFSLMARVEAAGGEPIEGEIEITRDGSLLDVQPVSIEPGKPWERMWSFTGEKGGRFEARLTTEGTDHLGADDRAAVELKPLETLDVVLVSPADAFLDAVFHAIPNVRVSWSWPPESAGEGDPTKIFVFNRAAPPDGFRAKGLVLLAPEESGFWGEYAGEMGDPLVSDVDEENPVLRFASIANVRAGRAVEFKPAENAKVFASSFDRPVVFGQWDRGRHWVVVGFDLDKGDFVFRTAFPIVMSNLIQGLRADATGDAEADAPGATQTRLDSAAELGEVGEGAPKRSWLPWTVRPLWWWALLFGLLWLLGEWWTYHRRITE